MRKLLFNPNSTANGSSLPFSQLHSENNLQTTYPHPPTTDPHFTISHCRKLPPTNIYPLTSTASSTSLRHRDNPNARFIKNELRSLHLALPPSSKHTAARLKAFAAECDAFSGELLEIAVDLKAIGMDITEGGYH
ncbi:hypothetical protein IFR05_014681 [Cadophora sp. M221]|nr:hypothetical protein IFR05_014681 [Cadophora sp. M221]